MERRRYSSRFYPWRRHGDVAASGWLTSYLKVSSQLDGQHETVFTVEPVDTALPIIARRGCILRGNRGLPHFESLPNHHGGFNAIAGVACVFLGPNPLCGGRCAMRLPMDALHRGIAMYRKMSTAPIRLYGPHTDL